MISVLQDWINDELSTPNKETNNLPLCPYAKKAWEKNEVFVITTEDLWKNVYDSIQVFDDSYKVIICVCEEHNQSYEELESACIALNGLLAEQGKDIWLLSFMDKYAMVFVQRLSDLDDASRVLAASGYYDNYGREDYLKLIVDRAKWRQINDARKKETSS